MLKVTVAPTSLRAVDNLEKATRTLKERMRDRSEPLRKVKQKQITRWARNFDSEGRIYGKWPALSPTWTIPDRLDAGHGAGPILVREGALRTHFVNSNEAGQVNNQAIHWDHRNQPGAYIVSHHTGFPNPIPNRRPIPARPLWDLDPEDEESARKIMEDWIDRIIGQYFK
jgi:phage gpG-like protein